MKIQPNTAPEFPDNRMYNIIINRTIHFEEKRFRSLSKFKTDQSLRIKGDNNEFRWYKIIGEGITITDNNIVIYYYSVVLNEE